MKVTVLLRNDHEMVKALFDKFNKLTGTRPQNGKRDLFNQIRRELLIHTQMEHEIFYPAIAATPSPRASELLAKAEQQHRSIEKLLQELHSTNGTDKNFDARMSQLMDEVTAHIEMEEEEIFEEARKNLAEYRLEELGLEMEDRKKILVTLAA